MNPGETAEIRRRLNPEKGNPSVIHGLYVTDGGEIISEFRLVPGAIPAEECEKYMGIFKKLLSGTPGANLRGMDFTTMQMSEGEEYARLTHALDTRLEDEEARYALYTRVQLFLQQESADQAQSVEKKQAAPNWLLLLLHDGYDRPLPKHHSEGDAEAGSVFHYIMCALCPVKQTSPGLSYAMEQGDFRVKHPDWIASPPEVGFTFPALEEGGANISRAVYYTRTTENEHPAFLQLVLGMDSEMPALEQQERFQELLAEALPPEDKLSKLHAVHETITGMIEEQKADKTAEPLKLTPRAMRQVLEDCGVDTERAKAFGERCTESFGQTEIPAVNLLGSKQFKVEAPGVSIRTTPELSETLQTRIIDGRPYILVPVDGDVEVNGVLLSGEGIG